RIHLCSYLHYPLFIFILGVNDQLHYGRFLSKKHKKRPAKGLAHANNLIKLHQCVPEFGLFRGFDSQLELVL
ncbi:UNVERIFIED_CONTAM: hypothetical protein ABIC26_005250, partial [Paenibacillus sp. PvR008]